MFPPGIKIGYGGDYNPEQWPQEIRDTDLTLFDQAGIDTLTVGVFSWALFQSDETSYDFAEFDTIMDQLAAAGKQVCLATGTGAHPPWLARKYPDVTRVDFEGRKHLYGNRHNACYSSEAFKEHSLGYVEQLVRRYADYDNVIAWHVGNEFGGACYCDNCAVAFRDWLRHRYETIERLNQAWYTTFWSHTLYDWDDVVPPSMLTEHWRGPNHTAFQGISVDYLRFTTDNMIASYLEEKKIIRRHSQAPVTTNFMGTYRPLDYHRWAPHLDFASWDMYPPDDQSQDLQAMWHDAIRGLKRGDPFWLMEQTPSTTANRDVNPVKRPGVMRLWSYQAVAHGADAVLFFQMRQSRGASERNHGAVIDHSGRNDTRVFTEVSALGAELQKLNGEITGARSDARIAMLLDWDAWWTLELSDGPTRLIKYIEVLRRWYAAFHAGGVNIDVIDTDADLSGYDVLLAPVLQLVKGDLPERVQRFVSAGGSFLTTFLSGWVDEDTNAFLTAAPGPFAEVTGIRVTETDSQPADVRNGVQLADGSAGPFDSSLIFDVIEPQGAEVIGRYTDDFYAGAAAVTRNSSGSGAGWYVGTRLDQAGTAWVARQILDEAGISTPYGWVPGLEARERLRDDARYLFLLNHGGEELTVTVDRSGRSLLDDHDLAEGDRLVLAPTDVVIIKSPLG